MIRFVCEMCRKAIEVDDRYAGMKTACPGCRALVMVPAGKVAPVPTPAPAGQPPAAPPQEAEVFEVRFGIHREHDCGGNTPLMGTLLIRPHEIIARGSNVQTAAAAGGAAGGIIGALIGAAIAKSKAKKNVYTIETVTSCGYCDAKRRIVSVQVPDGRWLIAKPIGKFRKRFNDLAAALERALPQPLITGDLNRMTTGQKAALWVVGGLVALIALSVAILAISER